MKDRWFHYVRLGDLADWLMCGWMPTPALVDTRHGFYAVLCEWPCGCPMARPRGLAVTRQEHQAEVNAPASPDASAPARSPRG